MAPISFDLELPYGIPERVSLEAREGALPAFANGRSVAAAPGWLDRATPYRTSGWDGAARNKVDSGHRARWGAGNRGRVGGRWSAGYN